MSRKANNATRRHAPPPLPSNLINSLYYSGRLCRENVLMLRDSHNVCAAALPKNGISLFLDVTAQLQPALERLLHY